MVSRRQEVVEAGGASGPAETVGRRVWEEGDLDGRLEAGMDDSDGGGVQGRR